MRHHKLHHVHHAQWLVAIKLDFSASDTSLKPLDKESKDFLAMAEMFKAWEAKAEQLRSGEITKEEYDDWRYNYPNSDTSGTFKKISSFD